MGTAAPHDTASPGGAKGFCAGEGIDLSPRWGWMDNGAIHPLAYARGYDLTALRASEEYQLSWVGCAK